MGPPAAELVKETKLIESSIGVADRVGNEKASAIVPSRTRTATPITRNRLVVLGMVYATGPKSDDASVGTARATFIIGELGQPSYPARSLGKVDILAQALGASIIQEVHERCAFQGSSAAADQNDDAGVRNVIG